MTIGLAGDVDVLAVVVCGDRVIARGGALATVDTVGGDFVRVGDRESRREGHEQIGELHGGIVAILGRQWTLRYDN